MQGLWKARWALSTLPATPRHLVIPNQRPEEHYSYEDNLWKQKLPVLLPDKPFNLSGPRFPLFETGTPRGSSGHQQGWEQQGGGILSALRRADAAAPRRPLLFPLKSREDRLTSVAQVKLLHGLSLSTRPLNSQLGLLCLLAGDVGGVRSGMGWSLQRVVAAPTTASTKTSRQGLVWGPVKEGGARQLGHG